MGSPSAQPAPAAAAGCSGSPGWEGAGACQSRAGSGSAGAAERCAAVCLSAGRGNPPTPRLQSPNLAHPTARDAVAVRGVPCAPEEGAQPRGVWPCPGLNWDLPSSDVMLPPGPGRWWQQGRPQVQILQRIGAGRCNTSSDLEQAGLLLSQAGSPGGPTGPAEVQIPVRIPA